MIQNRRRYWSEVSVGEALEPLSVGPIERVQIVRYASAIDDFDPLHVDEVAARDAGMPGIHAHALLGMGFLSRLVTRWQGMGSHLEHLSARFSKIIWPGDRIVCHGRVAKLTHEEGNYRAGLEIWCENQKGELILKGSARVRLFHSAEDEARQVRGEGPMVLRRASCVTLQDRIGAPLARRRRPVAKKRATKKKTAKKKSTKKTTKRRG